MPYFFIYFTVPVVVVVVFMMYLLYAIKSFISIVNNVFTSRLGHACVFLYTVSAHGLFRALSFFIRDDSLNYMKNDDDKIGLGIKSILRTLNHPRCSI